MKTCPVCGAVAFDDQMTCYGCLHDFGQAQQAAEGANPCAPLKTGEESAAFLLSLVLERQDAGTLAWSCTVEPLRA